MKHNSIIQVWKYFEKIDEFKDLVIVAQMHHANADFGNNEKYLLMKETGQVTNLRSQGSFS